jgi:hypothetical protein
MSDQPRAVKGATESTMDVPEWSYFAEALAWYDGPNLTGAQTFGVIEALRQALRDGRVKPDDLGMVRVDPLSRDYSQHGSGCMYPRGAPCDCTAKDGPFWKAPRG